MSGFDEIMLQNLVRADQNQSRRSLDDLIRAVLALAAPERDKKAS
ncbi:hypothetical protein QQM39_39615 [Streptomyces sp. DT2A-34]|nr:hypothetical protein [Streptomyces sp. DT2A-34]MDO0916709.1 hypothetical protein [Streptomyces sp. DT2A-34]